MAEHGRKLQKWPNNAQNCQLWPKIAKMVRPPATTFFCQFWSFFGLPSVSLGFPRFPSVWVFPLFGFPRFGFSIFLRFCAKNAKPTRKHSSQPAVMLKTLQFVSFVRFCNISTAVQSFSVRYGTTQSISCTRGSLISDLDVKGCARERSVQVQCAFFRKCKFALSEF